LDLFAAFRFDNHPFWGNNLSPRLGFIFAPNNKMRLRLSYQTGFRGVVGLNYGGGYRGDGHLSVQNYDKVAEAQIPLFDKDNNITGYAQNIPKPLPEKIQTIETQINYQIAKNWNIDGTFFYNNIKNVIGVGVIWADATLFAMKKIGSDIPPAWNGYWFFVNTPGTFDQYGAEIVADYKAKAWQINFSHSLVRLANVSQEQVNGLYISSNKRTRVFPENVTRLNILGKFGQKWSTSLNGLYYYEWYAPNGVRVEGNFLLNGTLGYKIGKRIELFATAKNLLNQNRLYPMQSNPGDGTSSPGTPAVEARTFWLRAEMNF
jgi:outer membrane receptor protein involved in Fe transport